MAQIGNIMGTTCFQILVFMIYILFRYCLDKNYAGVLIIWDRMFGTFAQERKDEKIVYGLVDQPQFLNPMQHQIFYYGKVLEKAGSMTTLTDKVKAFVFGPGWFPGTERLGDSNGVPEIQHRQKYDPKIPSWMNVYVGNYGCFQRFIN